MIKHGKKKYKKLLFINNIEISERQIGTVQIYLNVYNVTDDRPARCGGV